VAHRPRSTRRIVTGGILNVSRFKRRKLQTRAHQARTILRASMSRDQLVHLDEIAVSILECEGRDDSEVGERWRSAARPRAAGRCPRTPLLSGFKGSDEEFPGRLSRRVVGD
jgi:hypothetical protein